MSAAGKITMLSPVAARPPRKGDELAPVRLGKPLAGVSFGLEVDHAWVSYRQVIDEWTQLLQRDGAVPRQLWVEESRNEKVKKSPEQVRTDIAEWSRLVECGVVGLGN